MKIKEVLNTRGCDEIKELFVPNTKLLEIMHNIGNTERLQESSFVYTMNKKEAFKDTIIFYDYFLKLRDVYYAKKILLGKYLKLKLSNPYKIPIVLTDNMDIFSGELIEHLVPGNKSIIAFKEIKLCGKLNEHSSISYAHEIMHTQIDSLKGSVKNYFNSEIMSIFIELVMSYYMDKEERLLNIEDKRRVLEITISLEELLKYLKNNSSKIDVDNEESVTCACDNYTLDGDNVNQLIDKTKYIVSGLSAYSLFYTFYFSKEGIKEEMIRMIQKVIDGEYTVEDYLKYFDVTNMCMQDEQRLVKYFNR